LFTGAEVIKSVAQRAIYGGLAETPFDPCYHKYCDTVANINSNILQISAQGTAEVISLLSQIPNLQNWLAN